MVNLGPKVLVGKAKLTTLSGKHHVQFLNQDKDVVEQKYSESSTGTNAFFVLITSKEEDWRSLQVMKKKKERCFKLRSVHTLEIAHEGKVRYVLGSSTLVS